MPQLSVAIQVLVTLYSPAQSPGVVTSEDCNANILLHKSVTDGTTNEGACGQFIVVGAGNGAITGASVSITLMIWDAVD